MRRSCRLLTLASVGTWLAATLLPAQVPELGLFTRNADVGAVKHAGSAEYDPGVRS